MGRRLARIGLPDHATISFNPLLPEAGDGTGGAINGGAGAPPAPVAPPAPTPPAAGAPAATGPHGYPENTPVAEMTDGQQAAYWKHYAKAHRAEADQHKAWREANEGKVAQYSALEAASRTEHERAVETARTEAAEAAREAAMAEARTTFGVQLVQAKLDAALTAKGLTADQMKALAGDGTRFIGAKGVDNDALTAFLAALPDKALGAGAPANLGGGRTTPVTATGTQAGVEAWERAHPKKRTTT